jgi:hypothetical protein
MENPLVKPEDWVVKAGDLVQEIPEEPSKRDTQSEEKQSQ